MIACFALAEPMAAQDPDRPPDATQRYWPSTVPRWIGLALFVYASVAVLAQAKNFLVPVVLAFLLAMVFAPLRRFLGRRGIPSAVSSFVIVLMLLAGFFAVVAALAMPVSTWIENAPKIERQVQAKLRDLSASINGIYEANKSLQQAAAPEEPGKADVQQVEMAGDGVFTNAVLLAPSVMTQFLFTFVLLLFLLASGDMFYEKLVHVIPTLKDKRRAVRIVYGIERQLSRYLMTITLINAGLGICVGVAMWQLGMPSPLVFGVIAFVFNYIPYLGAIGGAFLAGAVALVAIDGVSWTFIVAAVYLGLTAIEGQFVTPYFVGRKLRVNTVMVFLAVSFWAWLWSAVGMIVAVPLLVTVKTFCDHIDVLHDLGDFLSERHAESEPDPRELPTRYRS
ncbi:AI-2E family transporter [Endozoicomonas sp. G2_2]|uniref:AI-2E family transporter n=1 Tax=Endozoicomonas sp. G2_2 TaxID=2821092 RepID=UPI001ADBC336|nr:AI-2E family transporter [Endozoicomonas sp. G2_2]MBO9471434.1 AI-2E family transporter [Endozoicomonas sp. G2_2]